MVGKVLSVDDVKKACHPAWPYLQPPLKPVSEKEAWSFLKGVVDIHAHGAPEAWLLERPKILETCKKACEAGLKAICFKDHNYLTSAVAYVVQEVVDEWATQHGYEPTQIYGGVALNYAVGGLNPRVVKVALSGDFGTKTKAVYGPSVDSAWQYKLMGREGGISLIDEKGNVKPELKEIIQILASSDKKVFLESGHVTVEEMIAVAEASKDAGVEFVVTHANQEITVLTVEEAKELVKRGAWIELAQVSMLGTPVVGAGWIVNFDHSLKLIRELGPERIILISDAGQPGNPPIEAYKTMVRVLLSRGVSVEDLTKMCKENPARVIGLK
ncbi:MAG: DUF6282 family protein [Nitrososphaerales archaeon]